MSGFFSSAFSIPGPGAEHRSGTGELQKAAWNPPLGMLFCWNTLLSFYVILAFLSLAQLDEPETWISVLIIIPNTDNKYSIQRGASTTTPFDKLDFWSCQIRR